MTGNAPTDAQRPGCASIAAADASYPRTSSARSATTRGSGEHQPLMTYLNVSVPAAFVPSAVAITNDVPAVTVLT